MAAAHHPQEIERIEREADAGRDLLEGAGPIPAGIDEEVGAAIRRSSQHFAEHGCRW